VKRLAALVVLAVAALAVVAVRAGHEFPVYPSYYPHAITLKSLDPEHAADLLRDSKIQAYIGPEPAFGAKPPESLAAVESLGSFVVVHVNGASPLARDPESACAVTGAVIRELASRGDVTVHPYPVTPLHGDYLYYADLADAARERFLGASAAALPARAALKVRAPATLGADLPKSWTAPSSSWDAAIEAVDAQSLVAAAQAPLNGWVGPPWLRTGWFHAALLLENSLDDAAARDRVRTDRARLEKADYGDAVERINLERDLVTSLTAGCRTVVAGYTTKREYVSVEYSAGIENIDYDYVSGLNSPIFLRTVKLKDFPWNGWLTIGVGARPEAAWNPIAGFGDPFGRLLWAAVGDPAFIPAPNDVRWMLNRVSDVKSVVARP